MNRSKRRTLRPYFSSRLAGTLAEISRSGLPMPRSAPAMLSLKEAIERLDVRRIGVFATSKMSVASASAAYRGGSEIFIL